MSARARHYSPSDVTRAVKAIERAGVTVSRVRFTPDGFEVVAGEPEKADNANWFAGSPLYQ